uniref:C-reactive protein-like n=1 Tax=Semicossyphus pulcher TaxID=241346 RepID=UPI0037E91F56
MKISAVLFLIAFSTVLAGSVTHKTLVFPSESTTSYIEMVPQKPLNLSAFTLCMQVATELTGWREVILFAYRTKAHDELNVWREKDGRLSFYLAAEGVSFRVPELTAMQTHLCVTWDSISGASALFIDGRRSLIKIFKKGHTVLPGGKVLLGQDPDSYLGSFDAGQSFVGELSDVNMWDFVLPDSMVEDIACGESVIRGNIFDWETAALKLHGEVKLLRHKV